MTKENVIKNIIKTVSIPDKKNVDKFGNPTRWILKVIDPPEIRGMVAFPVDFSPEPAQEYYVEIVKRGERYLVVKLHTNHDFEEIHRDDFIRILRCKYCGQKKVEEIETPRSRAYRVYKQYEEYLRKTLQSRWYYNYVLHRFEELKNEMKMYRRIQSRYVREYWTVLYDKDEDAQEAVEKLKRHVYPCAKLTVTEEVDKIVGHGAEKETHIEWRYKSLVCKPVRDYDIEYYIFGELVKLAEEEMWRTIDLLNDRIMIHNTGPTGLISLRSLIPFSFA